MRRPAAAEASDRSDREHDSDPNRPEAPPGRVRSRSCSRRYRATLPRGPDRAEKAWPGPQRGDDKDELFLVDDHTGRARLDYSDDDWSPANDRPFSFKPMLDDMQREREGREGQRQEDDQISAEADDESEDGGPTPRTELIRRNRGNSRAILTSKADNVDSSITRPPIGKGMG